jgi:hypothetical protein
MFFAAILFPPLPFGQKFAAQKLAARKFVQPSGKMSVPKCMQMYAPMPIHLPVKIIAQQFVPKLTTTLNPKFAKMSCESSVRIFIPTLVRRFVRHFGLMVG